MPTAVPAMALLGLYQGLLGAALLVAPHWFAAPSYRAWSGREAGVGAAFLIAGALLLWVGLWPVRRGPIALAAFVLTAVGFGHLAALFAGVGALHGGVVYAGLTLGTLALALAWNRPAPTAFPSLPEPDRFLPATVHLVALLTGLLMLAQPDQYASPIYGALRPWLFASGLAFAALGGALLVADVGRSKRHPRAAAVAGLLLAAVAVGWGIGFAESRTWTGVMTYGLLALGAAPVGGLAAVGGIRDTLASPLRRRVALVAATALVGTAVVLTVATTTNAEVAARRRIEADAFALASSVSEELTLYVESRLAAARTAAGLPSVRGLDPGVAVAGLRSVFDAFPGFANLSLVDRTGRQIARVPAADLIDLSARPDVRRALAGELLAYGGVIPSLRTGELWLMVAAAVRDEATGEVVGAVSAPVELAAIDAQIDGLPGAAGRQVVVSDLDGAILARSAGISEERTGAIGQAVGTVRAELPGREGGTTYAADGQRYVAGFDVAERLRWEVVVQEPEADALADLRVSRDRAFGLLVAVGAGLAAISAVGAGLLLRPVSRLVGPVAELGHGNYDVALPAETDGEVGDLVRAVDRMRHKLRDREARLVVLNAELRESAEEAAAATRAKSQFLSTMSHELRTPLTSILGYAGVLLDGLSGELTPGQADDVGCIARGADRLLALINDVLDLSKVEAGRLEVGAEEVTLAALVEGVRAEVAPLAAQKGIALVVDLPTSLPPVVADSLRLRQVLLNLVGNAVKFTDEGHVTVSAQAGGGSVRIAVADTGVGIAPEALGHVFEEFRQADGTTTRAYGGTGLGLAIAKKLTELQGGGITVDSRLGVGSTFTIELPAATPASEGDVSLAPAASARERPAVAGADGKPAPPIVLLVEDDRDFALVVRRVVEPEGYRVVHTDDGAEALELAAELRPVLVLLDIVLPGPFDGWQVLHGLRTAPTTEDIPVVVTSSHDERGLGATLGATDYLVKPIRPEALRSALRGCRAAPPAEILVVDDEAPARDLWTRLLEAEGYRVRVAGDGGEALREIRRQTPDLVVLDLMMPGTDGFEVLETLRDDPTTRGLPVVVATAADLEPGQLAWLRGRTTDVLGKASLRREDFLDEVVASLDARKAALN